MAILKLPLKSNYSIFFYLTSTLKGKLLRVDCKLEKI